MGNFAIIAFLALAGLLLLFGCAGNASGQQGTGAQAPPLPSSSAQAGGSGATQLTESDVSLIDDTTSAQAISDLPVDDGSAAAQGTAMGAGNINTAGTTQLSEADVGMLEDNTSGLDVTDLPLDNGG